MGRLIEADALLSELEKYNDPSAREKNEYLFGMQQRLETCIELVKDAPTVDAVPVAHGEWVWVQYDANPEIGNFHCSKCRFIPAVFNMAKQHLKYCPECGAKMDGDGND